MILKKEKEEEKTMNIDFTQEETYLLKNYIGNSNDEEVFTKALDSCRVCKHGKEFLKSLKGENVSKDIYDKLDKALQRDGFIDKDGRLLKGLVKVGQYEPQYNKENKTITIGCQTHTIEKWKELCKAAQCVFDMGMNDFTFWDEVFTRADLKNFQNWIDSLEQ